MQKRALKSRNRRKILGRGYKTSVQFRLQKKKMVSTMASALRQQLINLAHSGGSHKDQAEK